MSKVTVQIGFYLENEHYAQMQAFLPRTQAIKIPQLKVEEKICEAKQTQNKSKKTAGRGGKSQVSKSDKSESKKAESQEQGNQQDDIVNQMQNQQQQQIDEEQPIIEDQQVEERVDSQKQEQNLLQYLEDQEDSQDELDDDIDDDFSSISRSISMIKNNPKTKRQKGERVGLMELPDRRPRKDKKTDQATQLIRRQQKERKRKQYLKKQVQAQQKATLDKILNQTGRKQKMKQEKQNEDVKKRDQKHLKNLGDIPKIITIEDQEGTTVMLHNTSLFPEQMTRPLMLRIRPECSKCGSQEGRYKIKNSNKVACSLNCYKLLV